MQESKRFCKKNVLPPPPPPSKKGGKTIQVQSQLHLLVFKHTRVLVFI
jgi:hypothetical protein